MPLTAAPGPRSTRKKTHFFQPASKTALAVGGGGSICVKYQVSDILDCQISNWKIDVVLFYCCSGYVLNLLNIMKSTLKIRIVSYFLFYLLWLGGWAREFTDRWRLLQIDIHMAAHIVIIEFAGCTTLRNKYILYESQSTFDLPCKNLLPLRVHHLCPP